MTLSFSSFLDIFLYHGLQRHVIIFDAKGLVNFLQGQSQIYYLNQVLAVMTKCYDAHVS